MTLMATNPTAARKARAKISLTLPLPFSVSRIPSSEFEVALAEVVFLQVPYDILQLNILNSLCRALEDLHELPFQLPPAQGNPIRHPNQIGVFEFHSRPLGAVIEEDFERLSLRFLIYLLR